MHPTNPIAPDTFPPSQYGKPAAGALATIIGAFKSAVTKRINTLRDAPGNPIWQRGYHDRVIRDEAELLRTCQYIIENPLHWNTDAENPAAMK